ncbi:MAG TPA: hypothetical protein VMU04_07845 [Candidatus Acidoferrum sp.]|nr:hypothetical protein [Candidatus Acidoferrum sp.]
METNIIIGWVPWPVAAATAIWFGIMAHHARKNAVVWAIGGGILGLIITTLVMGLGQAAFIPFTSEQQSLFRIKIGGLAIFIVLFLGWLLTSGMHRSLLSELGRPVEAPKTAAKEAAPAAPAAPAKPPGTPARV